MAWTLEDRKTIEGMGWMDGVWGRKAGVRRLPYGTGAGGPFWAFWALLGVIPVSVAVWPPDDRIQRGQEPYQEYQE